MRIKVIGLVTSLVAIVNLVTGENQEQQTHYGQLINKFNTYHHSVSGYVYSVNDRELLIKGFTYDGLGKDAYFWAGSTGTGPGPNGFIIPDQYGKTNVLQKSDNKDFTLNLPDNKKITEIKWIAVYDLSRFENFGDVYIPEGFEPPSTQTLPPLISKSDDCSSDQIELIDTKTIKIYSLNLNAADDMEIYFVVGKGHVPTLRSGASTVIPDDNGYLEPLRSYTNEDVELVLPGALTFTDNSVHWLSVYDKKGDKALGYVTIPSSDEASGFVPPSLRRNLKYEYTLPNCIALHRDFHVSWDVVGQTITYELVALANNDDWLGFGLSGSNSTAKMIGADIAIGRLDLRTGQGVVEDFNIDARAPCSQILEHKRGVCRDQDLGKPDSYQVLEGRRVGGALTVIKYRRQLKASDEVDRDIATDTPVAVIWALGRMMKTGVPGFHRLYPKHLQTIQFVNKQGGNSVKKVVDSGDGDEEGGGDVGLENLAGSCVPFLLPDPNKKIKQWGPFKIVDAKLRSFNTRIGPSAGMRGYEGVSGYANPGYAWYIHGYVTPELYMQRGLTYSFRVEGGNNPHNLETYHPFIITNEPLGGSASNLPQSRILAGVEVTRRGQPRPTSAGRLCLWKHEHTDRRIDEKYGTFEKFRNTLKLRCEQGSEPAILEVTQNSSWPDVVYYHSYTQSNMGWRIHIVDNVKDVSGAGSLVPGIVSLVFCVFSLLSCCS